MLTGESVYMPGVKIWLTSRYLKLNASLKKSKIKTESKHNQKSLLKWEYQDCESEPTYLSIWLEKESVFRIGLVKTRSDSNSDTYGVGPGCIKINLDYWLLKSRDYIRYYVIIYKNLILNERISGVLLSAWCTPRNHTEFENSPSF